MQRSRRKIGLILLIALALTCGCGDDSSKNDEPKSPSSTALVSGGPGY